MKNKSRHSTNIIFNLIRPIILYATTWFMYHLYLQKSKIQGTGKKCILLWVFFNSCVVKTQKPQSTNRKKEGKGQSVGDKKNVVGHTTIISLTQTRTPHYGQYKYQTPLKRHEICLSFFSSSALCHNKIFHFRKRRKLRGGWERGGGPNWRWGQKKRHLVTIWEVVLRFG